MTVSKLTIEGARKKKMVYRLSVPTENTVMETLPIPFHEVFPSEHSVVENEP